MWGHHFLCDCVVCLQLKRVFAVIRHRSPQEGFLQACGGRLKDLTSSLLEEERKAFEGQGSTEAPNSTGGGQASAAACSGPPPLGYHPVPFGPAAPLGFEPVGLPPPPLQAAAPTLPPSSDTHPTLSAKSQPTSPPEGIREHGQVKVEPEESPKSRRSPVVDVAEGSPTSANQERPELPRRKEKKRKSRSRSRKKKDKKKARKALSQSPEETSKRGESKRSASPRPGSYKDRPRGDPKDRSPSKKEEGRKEGSRRTPSREASGRREGSRRTPRPPSYSPPRREPRKPAGSGWRGQIPYSNHPRWSSSKNKGIVKRAKQELYNRGKGGRGKGKGQGKHQHKGGGSSYNR